MLIIALVAYGTPNKRRLRHGPRASHRFKVPT
jgi:hypothetical protein